MKENSVFDKAFDWLIEAEGGYANDPADRGGETKYGISRRSFPDLDIADLTLDQAKLIYHSDYWLRSGCYLLPDPLAVAVFGASVLHGVHRSAKFLQKPLCVMVDGIIGPKTMDAADKVDDVMIVLREMLSHRVMFLIDIVVNDASQKRFLRGWLMRLFSLHQFAMDIQQRVEE